MLTLICSSGPLLIRPPFSYFRLNTARSRFSKKRSISSTPEDNHTKRPWTSGISPQYDVLEPSASDFATLVKNGVFVDKSLAIKDFLRTTNPVHLLLRPRRSGKTVLLSMFRDFFGRTNPRDRAKRKKLFTSNHLAITQDPMFKREFGKYPVIYLDFSNISDSSMDGMVQNFKNHIAEVVERLCRWGTLKDPKKLSDDLQKFLQQVLTKTLPDSEWDSVVFRLSELLYELHKKEVVVLIDEYDTPMSYALQSGYFSEANLFFHHVFSSLLKVFLPILPHECILYLKLQNNKYLRGAMLVGILRVSKAGWLSGANNLMVFPLGETSGYGTACMFTEAETKKLYERQKKIRKINFTFDDLDKWYNGYYTLDGAKLFNPWSIGNALTQGILRSFWIKSGYDNTIQELITKLLGTNEEFRADCQTLLEGGEIPIVVEDQAAYASMPKMSMKELWSFLYYAGYLTSKCPRGDSGKVSAQIPNSEIRFEFRKWIQADLEHHMIPDLRGSSVKLFNDMIEGRFSKFSKKFGKLLLENVPKRIFGDQDGVYLDYIYAYLSSAAHAASATPEWKTVMEIVAGVAIIFYQGERGVIIELKRLPHKKKMDYRDVERRSLSHWTTKALHQCDIRHRAFMPKDIKIVHEYGIALLGPYCGVEARTMSAASDGSGRVMMAEYTVEMDVERRRKTYSTVVK